MGIRGASPSLRWLVDMMGFLKSQAITIPSDYRDKVLAVKNCLDNDVSGLVNSVLDFAINSANVKYTIETNQPNLTTILNYWLNNVNIGLLGKIPTGIQAFSKEYFRERWKGSSFLLLRTLWENVTIKTETFYIPTKMWFVEGQDIVIRNSSDNSLRQLGDDEYGIYIDKNDNKHLPVDKRNEYLFVQKPYESWGEEYPTPYIIKRGIYENLLFLSLMTNKAEQFVARALEYLFLIKKRTEKLALTGNESFIYNEAELTDVKNKLGNLIQAQKSNSGTSTHVANFDTEMEHLIPEYSKALKSELYSPIEKRILAGLGLVEIVEGTSSSRKESILNPKPFISEVNCGVNDFKNLLTDIMKQIVEQNKNKHKKYMNSEIVVRNTLIKEFVTTDIKQILRSLYDRGLLSKETTTEIIGEVDFNTEVERRKEETKAGLNKIMKAPVIQNVEKDAEVKDTDTTNKEEKELPEEKKSIEKKNFKNASCLNCGHKLENNKDPIYCDSCGSVIEYEEAPYKKVSELPDNVKKVLPKSAQKLWMKTFNENYKKDKNDDSARKIAWFVVKKVYKKSGDKWVLKNKSEVKASFDNTEISELLEIKKLLVLGKQEKILDEILAENNIKGNSDETSK